MKKTKNTSHKLAEKQKKQFAGCEISGKKLGIIGLGAIGAMVANSATHLGMEVYGYDPYHLRRCGMEPFQNYQTQQISG